MDKRINALFSFYAGAQVDLEPDSLEECDETRILCTKNYDKRYIYSSVEEFLESDSRRFVFALPTSFLFSKTKFYAQFSRLLFNNQTNHLQSVIFLPDDAVFEDMRTTLLIFDKDLDSPLVQVINAEHLALDNLQEKIQAIPCVEKDVRDIIIDGKTLYEVADPEQPAERKLKDICDIIRGVKNEHVGTEYHYLSYNDLGHFGYADACSHHTTYVENLREKFLIQGNDILFLFVCSVGACTLFAPQFHSSKLIATGNQVILRLKQDSYRFCSPEALYLYLRSQPAQEWIKRYTIAKMDHTPPRMLVRNIANMPIPAFSKTQLQKASEKMQELQIIEEKIADTRHQFNALLQEGNEMFMRDIF